MFTVNSTSCRTKTEQTSNLIIKNGNGQFAIVGLKASIPLSVLATTENGEPAPGIPVRFRLIVDPSNGKGSNLSIQETFSDSNALASTELTLGGKSGEYIVEAIIPGKDNTPVLFTVKGKEKNWIFILITGLLGGLGIFLYGMNKMSSGLQEWAGNSMKAILAALTKHRVYGLGVGIVVTAILNSSSATTVMLVGFTNAGLMSLRQAIGVILGADIGSTVTAQIVAFKFTDYALMFIGVGFIMMLAGGKRSSLRYMGEVTLGFGLMFYGLKVMSDVVYPLRSHPTFINMMAQAENPMLALLASAAFTSIIQSSGATTGLIVALSAQGLITLPSAIPLLFGANIGTCITAALATIGTTNRDAIRVAIIHYSFKIIGVLIFFFLIPQLAWAVEQFSIMTTSATPETVNSIQFVPRQIANAHTLFNLIMGLGFLPFVKQIEAFAYKIVPKKIEPEEKKKFGQKYLDPFLLDIPELAVRQAKREVLRMGKYTQRMIDSIIIAFKERNHKYVDNAIDADQKVDLLESEIKSYLTRLSQRKSSGIQSRRRIEMFFVVDELEKIGDIISKNIMPHIGQMIDQNLYFSEAGWKELNSYQALVSENFGRAMEAFRTNDLKTAEEIIRDKQRMLRYYKQLQMGHLQRLGKNEDTARTSQIHLDVLGNLRGINSCITEIAINMTELTRDKDNGSYTTEDEDDIDY